MADWEVYSSRNGNIYSTYFSSGSYLQQIENMVVDYDTIAADKMMSQNIDNYTTSLSDKIDAASNAGYFSTGLNTATDKQRLAIALNTLNKVEDASNKIIDKSAIGLDAQGGFVPTTKIPESYFSRGEDVVRDTKSYTLTPEQLEDTSPASVSGGTFTDVEDENIYSRDLGYNILQWIDPKTGKGYKYRKWDDGRPVSENDFLDKSGYVKWLSNIAKDPRTFKDPKDLERDTLDPTTARTSDPFGSLPWQTVYQGFVDDAGIGSPGAYNYALEQGLSGTPELRTAQTQFLIQDKYQANLDDPLFKGTDFGKALLGYTGDNVSGAPIDVTSRSNRNPYYDFLQGYSPLEGNDLMREIDNITNVIGAYGTKMANITDEETGETTQKEVPFSEYYDATKSYENLNPNELQALSWTTKFKTGENAEQYQKQLVALPILQNTPNVRKGEIVQVLNKLYNNWQRQPDRPADESWLEFARSKNYWGLTPSQTPTSGFGGYQGMFS